ncbi:MAG TPA: UDP-3-O-(3-hydroxymyristoyl)glucosamine N-acyltransferase, partial [Gemmatimonadales bacterium]|nr:UDP-3-O-(3-hydroxymyristoyl)glucosamine N-acyltransferase [Gemmatimonadales bacterium]
MPASGSAAAPVPLTAQAVAELVGGRLSGDGAARLTAVGPLERADGNTLSILVSTHYLAPFRASRAGAVLLRAEHLAEPEGPRTRIVVADPQAAMARVLGAMFPPAPEASGGAIHPTARLGRGVVLGVRVRLGPGVVLEEGVMVGDDTTVGANVVCGQGTRIGQRCLIKPGAVLGSPGFGFVSDRKGHTRIPHVGGCVLGDDVEIGANSCVDRGSIADTTIGSGTKLDNLVHVGHNARLGARCLVMGGSVIAGSAEIGDEVIVAGHAAIGGHFRVGNRARIGAKAGVISEVPEGADVSGFPARPHREFLRAQAALYRLAKITS